MLLSRHSTSCQPHVSEGFHPDNEEQAPSKVDGKTYLEVPWILSLSPAETKVILGALENTYVAKG